MVDINAILSEIGKREKQILTFEKTRSDYIAEKERILATIEEHSQTLNQLKEDKKAAQISVDELNLTVAEHENKLKELDEKRNYILTRGGKNADLELVKNKIAEQEADQAKLEDQVLKKWDQIEKLEESITAETANLDKIKANVSQQASDFDAKITKVDSQIADVITELEEQQQILKSESSDTSSFMQRLTDKGVRPTAVAVVDATCQGCFFTIPPDVANKVHDGVAFIKCPNCYRFMYVTEDEEETAEAEVTE